MDNIYNLLCKVIETFVHYRKEYIFQAYRWEVIFKLPIIRISFLFFLFAKAVCPFQQ